MRRCLEDHVISASRSTAAFGVSKLPAIFIGSTTSVHLSTSPQWLGKVFSLPAHLVSSMEAFLTSATIALVNTTHHNNHQVRHGNHPWPLNSRLSPLPSSLPTLFFSSLFSSSPYLFLPSTSLSLPVPPNKLLCVAQLYSRALHPHLRL